MIVFFKSLTEKVASTAVRAVNEFKEVVHERGRLEAAMKIVILHHQKQ